MLEQEKERFSAKEKELLNQYKEAQAKFNRLDQKKQLIEGQFRTILEKMDKDDPIKGILEATKGVLDNKDEEIDATGISKKYEEYNRSRTEYLKALDEKDKVIGTKTSEIVSLNQQLEQIREKGIDTDKSKITELERELDNITKKCRTIENPTRSSC